MTIASKVSADIGLPWGVVGTILLIVGILLLLSYIGRNKDGR